jgi:rare lipoprotein A
LKFPALLHPTACLALLLVFLSTGCLHHAKPVPVSGRQAPPSLPNPAGPASHPAPGPSPIVQGEEGMASWYGHPYHGRATASGEIYNMYGISAAHRTLPFST